MLNLGGYISGVLLIGVLLIVFVYVWYVVKVLLCEMLFVLWIILVVSKFVVFIVTDIDL